MKNRKLKIVAAGRFIVISLLVHLSLSVSAQTTRIKTVAILPFDIKVDSQMVQSERKIQENMSYDFQRNAYAWLLKKSADYTVEFQDIHVTNDLLNKAHVTPANISKTDKAKLSKYLGVDAILMGTGSVDRPSMAEKPEKTTALAVGTSLIPGLGIYTGSVYAMLNIYDTAGAVMWTFERTRLGFKNSCITCSESTPELMKVLMKAAARRFPFKKPS